MLENLKKTLKKMGVSRKQIAKLTALSNPNTAREHLCSECFDRMFMSAHSKQFNPAVLIDRLCSICKLNLENYLKEE